MVIRNHIYIGIGGDILKGVILLRGQPVHTGHLKMIQTAIDECDEVLVILGSADKYYTERNPFTKELRLDMLEKGINSLSDCNKVSTMWLNDWSSDKNIPKQDNLNGVVDNPSDVNKEWGQFLYYNIVRKLNCKEFIFYYSDDISLINAWFPDYIRTRITLKSLERFDDFSSSAVRKALLELDMIYLNKALNYLTNEQILKLSYCFKTKKEVFL